MEHYGIQNSARDLALRSTGLTLHRRKPRPTARSDRCGPWRSGDGAMGKPKSIQRSAAERRNRRSDILSRGLRHDESQPSRTSTPSGAIHQSPIDPLGRCRHHQGGLLSRLPRALSARRRLLVPADGTEHLGDKRFYDHELCHEASAMATFQSPGMKLRTWPASLRAGAAEATVHRQPDALARRVAGPALGDRRPATGDRRPATGDRRDYPRRVATRPVWPRRRDRFCPEAEAWRTQARTSQMTPIS